MGVSSDMRSSRVRRQAAKKPNKERTVQVRFSDEELAALDAICSEKKMTRSAFLRSCVEKVQGGDVEPTYVVTRNADAERMASEAKSIGVNVIDGSNKPAASPFFGTGRFRQFRIAEGRLQPVSEVRGGQWLQGAAYSTDGRSVVVQDAANRQLRLYRSEGGALADTGERLGFDGAPCAVVLWR